MAKNITKKMIMIRLATVSREMKEGGYSEDTPVTLNIDGNEITLTTANFEINDYGDFEIRTGR